MLDEPMTKLNEYVLKSGEILVYTGSPNVELLEDLSKGPGDCWHSSFEQGLKNAFSDIVYQSAVFWWYVNDFDGLSECISWRLNSEAFVMRKTVWEHFGGFDKDFKSKIFCGIVLGFDLIRNGGIPLYVSGLYTNEPVQLPIFPIKDIYTFFRKKFRPEHSRYLLLRRDFFNIKAWYVYFSSTKKFSYSKVKPLATRRLEPLNGSPTVSCLIPTMRRQKMTNQLLIDLNNQSYLPTTVIVVDATPKDERQDHWYNKNHFNFNLIVKWQETKGSCRARNEAIELSNDDFIIFADDDIRIQPDYIENHLRFLQTNKAVACNGLDIQADNFEQGLKDLENKIAKLPSERFQAGVSSSFNNANSCVRRDAVMQVGGNDINYDGGYGEDGDFGLSLVKLGIPVLYNPFSRNLHLKPPSGGYRWWGSESEIIGKKRKVQPWEMGKPVGKIRPIPSPTVMYQILKHYDNKAQREYCIKHFLYHFIKGRKQELLIKLINLPIKILQYRESIFYAKRLIKIGRRIR